MKQIKDIKDRILEDYGEHVLDFNHADFDFDIYMMFICRSIEVELMNYKSRQDQDYQETVDSIVQIIQTYKERK